MLRHGRNLGQSRGIRSGVLAAKGEIIVTLDGDGQNDPADIPKLLAMLRSDPGLALVSGVRVKRKTLPAGGLASRLGNGFRNWLLKDGAADTGCGLKAFRRERLSGAALFRSYAPLSDRADAARRMESGLCAGASSAADGGPLQIHQFRPPAGERERSSGRALADAAAWRHAPARRNCNGLSWRIGIWRRWRILMT